MTVGMAKTAMLLMAVGVLLICCNIGGASAFKTNNVTFFVHDSILVPNATATIVAGPGGDLTKLQKGAILVTDTVITKTADPNSAPLGKFEGQYILDGGIKYRIEATIIIDFPGDLVETTYEVLGLQTTGHWPWLQARDSSGARQGTPLFIPWHKNYLAQMVRKPTPSNGPSSLASRYDRSCLGPG